MENIVVDDYKYLEVYGISQDLITSETITHLIIVVSYVLRVHVRSSLRVAL